MSASLLGVVACTTSEPPPPAFTQVENGSPVAAQLNSNVSQISFGNPSNVSAIDEDFDAVTTSITVSQNESGGFEFVSQNRGDFNNRGIAQYDASANTLTLNIQQNDIDLFDTFGPFLLADPGDFVTIENDNLAFYLAAFPDSFPSLNIEGVESAQFDPADFFLDPNAADDAITSLQNLGDESFTEEQTDQITNFLATLNNIAEAINDQDFFNYTGVVNGTSFSQLQTTDTGSGITTNYVALGTWVSAPTAEFDGDVIFGTTIYGQFTPEGEIPQTGSATYNGSVVGTLLRQNSREGLRGGFNTSVNFGTNVVDIDANLSIVSTDVAGNTLFTPLTTLTGTGSINGGNFFNGNLRDTNDASLTGAFQGAFFGPSAAEVGGTFDFTSADYAGSAAWVGAQTGN